MSATKDFINSKMFDRIIVGIITFLVALSIYSVKRVDLRNDTIQVKVEQLDKTKADIQYVDKEVEHLEAAREKRFVDYEKAEQQRWEMTLKILEEIQKDVREMRKSN